MKLFCNHLTVFRHEGHLTGFSEYKPHIAELVGETVRGVKR